MEQKLNETDSFVVKTNSYTSRVFAPDPLSRVVFRDHQFSQDKREPDAHPDYWSLALFNLVGDGVSVDTGRFETTIVNGPIAVFLPRFSIVEWVLKRGQIQWIYLVSRTPTPVLPVAGPRAFLDVNFDQVFKLITQPSEKTVSWILNQEDSMAIGRNGKDHIVPEKLKQGIDSQFRSSKKISEISMDLGFSSSMASRLFKQKYGLSPVEYRNQLRMKQSAVDLLYQDQTVEATQYSVGIEDPSYFYKCFKRHLNGTPSQFRLCEQP